MFTKAAFIKYSETAILLNIIPILNNGSYYYQILKTVLAA